MFVMYGSKYNCINKVEGRNGQKMVLSWMEEAFGKILGEECLPDGIEKYYALYTMDDVIDLKIRFRFMSFTFHG